ncbi:MAG: hypothetical protein GY856_35145 [bacterium]|nr:hypothetical protein [bacterium]
MLTWSWDNTARLWDVGADLDFPADSVVLQVRAVTGTEFIPLTREIRVIEPGRWRKIKSDWERMARSHYKVCRYPRYNLWRRFHKEEAERIRPLK